MAQGCKEMASDAPIENEVSSDVRKAVGFEAQSRAVHLRKQLPEAKEKTLEGNVRMSQRTLLLVEGTFAICRLDGNASIPPWVTASSFFSITRTAEELSVVCSQDAVPEGVICERGWRCLRVAGTMPFSVIGVLASLTTPLADVGISVFAVSTFDTDYLLVKEADFGKAIDVLRWQGHTIQ
jgi:hypothetical protein